MNQGIPLENIVISDYAPPQDGALLELLKTKDILYQNTLIKAERIKPFSDFVPTPNPTLEQYLLLRVQDKDPHFLLVYEKDGTFIMSDDYNVYYFYKEYDLQSIPCTIIGPYKKSNEVEELGEPYKNTDPTIEVINE